MMINGITIHLPWNYVKQGNLADVSLEMSNEQCGRPNIWSTCLKTNVPYKFYTKFHSSKANFLLAQLKMHLHWWVGKH